MNIIRVFILFCTISLPTLVGAAEAQRLTAISSLNSVTLYPDQAMTTRSATMTLQPGSYIIIFDNLPALVQDDSVRIEGRGTSVSTIVGIEVKHRYTEQISEKRVKELEEEIRTIERQIGSLESRSTALLSQKKFIDSLRVAWGDRISKELAIGKPTSAELNEALLFVGSSIIKAEEQGRDIETEKRQLAAKSDLLRRQKEQVTGSQRKEIKSVEVSVEVAKAGTLALELNSVTPQASWEPAYDVRLAADGNSAELTFRAIVTQQTGEDWTNINLALSTARPSINGTPPEFYPWRLSFYRPAPPPMPAAAPMPARAKKAKLQKEQSSDEYLAEMSKSSAPAAFLTAQVADEQSSVLFRIPRQVDIPTDGSRHGNIVAIEKMPVKLEFLALPKLSPFVFLKSELVNQTTYPLLAGKVNIFSGANFTGSSTLKKVAAGEKFDLFFGTDDQITVKREELKRHTEAGLFSKNKMGYRYRIEIQNLRKNMQTVTIRDQLPVSGEEEIKVSIDESSIKPDEVKEDGRITWKIPLQPGEKKELLFGMQVEYPKDREVNGL